MKKNSTPFTLEQIEAWPLLVTVKNNWRQRLVTVFPHPTDTAQVVTVGKPFDGTEPIICIESREDWTACLAKGGYQTYN